MSDVVISETAVGVELREIPGCLLKFECDTDGKPLSEDRFAGWLANKSGLSDEYSNKILTFDMWEKEEEAKTTAKDNTKYAAVRFDATANCFEAMQQIRNTAVTQLVRQSVNDIACPCGQFKTVTLHPRRFELLMADDVYGLLAPSYGEICDLEYKRTQGIRDGRVKVVMFVPGGDAVNKFRPLSECNKDKWLCERIEVAKFNPATDGRVLEELVQELWGKYGPNATRNNGERGLSRLAVE